MQQGMAKLRQVRISPRKARLAANLIRGRTVEEAKVQLGNCSLRAGRDLLKVLNSAVANAETQTNAKREDLRVIKVFVDAGPIMKRAKPKNKGGSHPIMKRTSHFTIIVAN